MRTMVQPACLQSPLSVCSSRNLHSSHGRTECFSRKPLRHGITGGSSRSFYRSCKRGRCAQASSADPASSSQGAAPATAPAAASPQSAREAVERGQQSFDRGQYAEALQLFRAALEMAPDEDEARAALYNGACANTRLKNWQAAADGVVRAVNEYSLKLEVAAKDPDLAALRERREWLDALEVVKGGVSTKALVGARAEARAPFRLARLFLFGGLGAGAAIGLVIITGRLIAALKGGEGAPELGESLTNFSVNAAALAALSWLFSRDLAASQRDSRAVEREEALGRLLVMLGPGRVVPLARFRGALRPVLLAGSQGYLNRALKAAELHRTELRARGVSVVALPLSSADPAERLAALKRDFLGKEDKGKGFGAPAPGKAEASKADARWQLTPAATAEWEAWLRSQKEAAGVKGDDVYVQVQLDGSVQRSGLGVPPWDKWLDDIPELDSLRTRLTDGARASR